MQLQLLGCGSSMGVPTTGCACAVCSSDHPRNKRFRTSAVIRLNNGKSILIDASPDLRIQALTWKVTRVDAVLFTHAHADHILGIEDLRGFNFSQRSSIPCYGSPKTLSEIKRFFQYIFEPDPNYQGGGLAQLTTQEIEPYAEFEVCGERLQAFDLIHGNTPVTGFRIGSVGYATDCNTIPPRSLEVLKGVETLVLDGLRYVPHRTHLSIPQAIEISQHLGVKKTYLVHTTHAVDYEEVSKKLPAGVELGYDGLTIDF